jgi:hypothetical protein
MAKIGRFLIFVTLAVDSHDIPCLLISGWSDCFGTAPGLKQVSDRVRIVVPQGPDESRSPVPSAGVGIQKKWRVGTVVKSPFPPLLSATAREFPVVE